MTHAAYIYINNLVPKTTTNNNINNNVYFYRAIISNKIVQLRFTKYVLTVMKQLYSNDILKS